MYTLVIVFNVTDKDGKSNSFSEQVEFANEELANDAKKQLDALGLTSLMFKTKY